MKSILALLICLPYSLFAQYTYDKLQVSYLPTEQEARAFTYENLRLYPIRARDNFKAAFRDVGNYLSLKEAMEKKKVKITEKANGGSVNTLTIENISTDTIIVITGEIVKGGKQDRIIQKDVLLQPKSGKKDLPVFCVESGRWSYRSASTTTSTPASSGGEFSAHYGVGTMGLRKVVEKENDQSKVWSKVDEINTKNKTMTATKTYTALGQSADFNRRLQAYVQFFKQKFSADPDVIGVVVASGDSVLGCDMFATPQLFKQNFENLLHSYASEAILNGKAVAIAPRVVKAYMDRLLTSEHSQEATLKEKGTSFVDKGKKLRVSSFD